MIPLGVLAARRFATGSPVVIYDDFNRANGPLGANWTDQVAGLSISGNVVVRGASNATSYHNTPLSGPDHYAQFVRAASPASGDPGVTVRHSTAAETYYMGRISSNEWQILRRVAGTFTVLASTAGTSPASPVTIRLEAEGTTLRLYADGVLKVTTSDSTITSGNRAGVRMFNTSSIDDFEAGDL